MNTSVKITYGLRKFMLCACVGLLGGCTQFEIETDIPDNIPGKDEMNGDLVEMRISLNDIPMYGGNAPESRSSSGNSSSTDRKVLVSEWVKPERFTLNRSGVDNEGPAIAEMELFEETDTAVPSSANTRSSMTAGIYFRVIAFKKDGSNYVYQAAADYTASPGAPSLIQGSMGVIPGRTYRFVAYSYNSTKDIGPLPINEYQWLNTGIDVPNQGNDFLTFDSGDKQVTGNSFELPITFIQQLCKLTVKISATGLASNTFNNCKGVYIKEGGYATVWSLGSSTISPTKSDSPPFDIPDNSTTTSTRLVPFGEAKPITVHFGTLTVGGEPANNMDITSSQSVKLAPGKHYTMTVQFKPAAPPPPYIQVPKGDINLGGAACTDADKTALSLIKWAEGNLASTGSSNYLMAGPKQYGYYYQWQKYYTGTVGDPCNLLDASKYGSGWVTPSYATMQAMARCTDQVLVPATGSDKAGMWFMNKTSGLFLPVAGYRSSSSGMSAEYNAGEDGYYWSREESDSSNGYYLYFTSGNVYTYYRTKPRGFSVRCVQEP